MEPTSDQKYGGCEGPDAMYVKLISYDGHEFIIRREYALTSGTIKAMLSGPGNNSWTNLFLFKIGIYNIYVWLFRTIRWEWNKWDFIQRDSVSFSTIIAQRCWGFVKKFIFIF